MKPKKRWNAALDCLMVTLLPLLIAYSLIGETVHEWLGIAMLLLFLGHHALNWRWHRSLSQWGFCVMSLHLGLHWGMVLAMGRRIVKRVPSWSKALLRMGAALVCLWGVYAFARREIGIYLLLRRAFVFFDFEEPLALFLLDYLTIIGLLAEAGYYGQNCF